MLRRWICPTCRLGAVRHGDPVYGRPSCEGAVSDGLLLREPHAPVEMLPLDVRHE